MEIAERKGYLQSTVTEIVKFSPSEIGMDAVATSKTSGCSSSDNRIVLLPTSATSCTPGVAYPNRTNAEKRRSCAKAVNGERTRGVEMEGNEEKRGVTVSSYSAESQEVSALTTAERKRTAQRSERYDIIKGEDLSQLRDGRRWSDDKSRIALRS